MPIGLSEDLKLSTCEGKKYCLVLVQQMCWSCPSSKQDAGAVAKFLLREILPRWGIPTKLMRPSCEGNVWFSWLWPQISSLLSPTKQRCCWNIGLRPGATSRDSKLYDDCMLNHCVGLSASLPALHSQVKATLPTPADTLEHRIKPGDWVVSKDFRRTHWKQRRFTGPF